MRAAYLELKSHGDSLRAIWATSIQRGGLTAATLMALLLERNTFNPSNKPDLGLAGFASALAIAGIGIGVGAVISPWLVARFGRHKLIRAMMLAGIPALIFFAFIQNELMLIVAAFLIGLAGQSVKVTTDALVQSKISDEFRGRAFAFYDVTVNSSIVLGAAIAAILLPTSGKSTWLPFVISGIFGLAALTILRPKKFNVAA
jgi:MFS family permease